MSQYWEWIKNFYRISKRNLVHYFVLLLECFVIIAGVINFASAKTYTVNIPLESLELVSGITKENGDLYIDESYYESQFLGGPHITLEKGCYKLKINYKSYGAEGYLYPCDVQASYNSLLTDEYVLDEYSDKLETYMYVEDEIYNFECKLFYNGKGSLSISSIEIERTNRIELRECVFCILFVLIIQMCYLIFYMWHIKNKISFEKKCVYLGLLFVWVLTSYPLFTDYLIGGHDFFFHLKRIEGIHQGLVSGQFPVRIQPGWWNGAGYATGVYYPDLFLYFPAMLRMLGINVQEAYRVFLMVLNAFTCIISYWSFNKIIRDSKIALIGTMIYTMSIYRMTCIYIRSAVGEVEAMAFLPLVIYGFYRIIYQSDEENDAKFEKASWIPLAIGMSGIVCSHIISLEFMVAFLILLCLLFARRLVVHKKWLLLVKAAVFTLLLNAWFIIPLIDYYTDGHNISLPITSVDIQKHGTFLGQLLMMFPSFSSGVKNEYAIDGVYMEMPLGLGISVIVLLGMLVLLVSQYGKSNEMLNAGLKFALVGVIAIVFSLHSFPWNRICEIHPIVAKLATTIQYLWRYIWYAMIFLSVSGIITLSVLKSVDPRKMSLLGIGIGIVSVVSVLFMNDTVMSSTKYIARVYTAENLTFSSDVMYLPIGSDSATYSSAVITASDESVVVGETYRNGMNIAIEVSSSEESLLTVPFVYYDGYQAKARTSDEKLNVVETSDKMVGVILPKGFEDVVEISFVGKWYWRFAEAVSILTLVSLLLYLSGFRNWLINVYRKNK